MVLIKKPGVMLYHNPLRKLLAELSDQQAGALFKAVMEFSAAGTVPEFEDTMVRMVWDSIFPALDRDGERYETVKNGRKYAAYCRHAKERDMPVMRREEWEEAGSPTIKDILKNSERTNGCNCMPVSVSMSMSNPVSMSTSMSNSNPEPQAAPAPFSSPATENSFADWMRYQEEKRRETTHSMERELRKRFQDSERKFGPDTVAAFVSECISNGWNTIRWEILEERKGGGKQGKGPEVDRVEEIRKYV